MSWSGSPKKGLNFSAKNSPRRLPARSPSELTPFSFSEDSLKILATDIERQNGKIPMHLPLRSGSTPSTPCPGRTAYSQPRTPNSEFGPPINYSTPLGTSPCAPPRHLPLGSSLSCGSFTPALGGGSLGTPGRSIRDLEESFKDIKKENFSLKLRIFYLEERMGRNMGEHDIINSNINLKVQVESLRQEMQEKDELLQEATNTLDILDQKLRNSERKHEQEMAELLDRYVENSQPKFELGSPRKSMKSPDVCRKLTSPAGGRKLFNYDEFVNKDDRLVLGILEEKDEVLENPGLEVLLQQNQLTIQRMQSQLKHKEEEIQVLTNSMKDRQEELGRLQQQLQVDQESADRLILSLQSKDDLILELNKKLQDSNFKILSDEIEFKNQEIQEFRLELRNRESRIEELNSRLGPGKHISVQTEPMDEDERVRKLQDELRLQTQERKLLLKKIQMLRDQEGLQEALTSASALNISLHRTGSPGSNLGVQCNLGEPALLKERAYLGSVKRYRSNISVLRKRLAASTDACDALREQLESLVESAESVSQNDDEYDELRRMIVVSRDLSRSVGNSLIRNMEENVDLESETSSDESTWNLELPNISGINLDSDSENTELTKDSREPELSGELVGFGHEGHREHGGLGELGGLGEHGGLRGLGGLGGRGEAVEDDSDVCNHVIQHLHEEIEKREITLRSNQSIISSIQSELREKDRIIREQVETINSYREELVCLDDPTSYGGGNLPCPNQRRREADRSQLRRLRRRVKLGLEKRSTPETNVGLAQALSEDSCEYSEPEPGISLARIGLQTQLVNDEHCACNSSIFFSDSETEQNNCSSLTSCASACLSSSSRIIQGLVGSILHGLDECELLDSGIEEDVLDVEELEEDPLNLCSSCTRSLPREFGENLHDVQRGLLHVQQRIQFRKYKLERRAKRGMPAHEKDVYQLRAEVEELKDKLNTNYILVAQLSAENLRIQGEKNRLDEAVKERTERMKDMENRIDEMEEKILNLNSSLEDKQKEIEGWRRKGDELDTARRELEAARRELKILEEQVQQLKAEIEKNDYRETVFEKSSPETSSSFDYMNCSTNTGEVGSRPRAFSSCTRSFPVNLGRDKLVDVSSPDLGVDVESDPFSSLERGYKVGSLAVDKLILENRNLRREKDVLGQKLVRSKAALQDTLSRLSRANLHKQDQVVSPAPVRRPISRVPSERGNLVSDSPPSLWSWSHESPGLRRRNPESPPPLPRVPDLNFKLRKNKSSRH